MTLVVDASAIASIVFGELEGATIAAHIEDETLIAPTLLDYELANIGWKKLRRHPASSGEMMASLARASHLSIQKVQAPMSEVLSLAIETGLSAYDAAYLWLAESRDVELVTLDRRLAEINQSRRESDQF